MIQSSLFIGLGTTGTEIVKFLRRFIFEEFGVPGLPIFRYLTVETDGGEDGQDSELPSARKPSSGISSAHAEMLVGFDQIQMIHATIPNLNAVKRKVDPSNVDFNPGLHDWLDADLFKFSGNRFEAGAGNIRMAGRLCLWENWDKIASAIEAAKGSIISEENVIQTREMLSRHYLRKNQPVPDALISPAPKIYVAGSLCGGSCGGMLTDIAYYLRNGLGQGDGAAQSLKGIFTTYDRNLTRDTNVRVRTANCFATLYELDFHNDGNNEYDVTFPDGVRIGPTNDTPFDYFLMISPTTQDPSIRLVQRNGSVDVEALNKMAALNIFGDVIGGAGAGVDKIRVDWVAVEGYGDRKREADGSTGYVRNMATFGLSGVWYPKYRVAGSAACSIGDSLCEQWLLPSDDLEGLKNRVETQWTKLLEESRQILTKSASMDLNEVIKQDLSDSRQKMERCSATDLRSLIRTLPEGSESFGVLFSNEGEYSRLIAQQVPQFERTLTRNLDQLIEDLLNSVCPGGTHTIEEVREALGIIDARTKTMIRGLTPTRPMFTVSSLDQVLSYMRKAENSAFTKFVFMRSRSVEDYRQRFIETFERLVKINLINLRNFYARSVLERLREYIGVVDVQSTGISTLTQRLDDIVKKVSDCRTEFQKSYEDLTKEPRQNNIHVIANNPKNSIEIDAERTARAISQEKDQNFRLIANQFLLGEDGNQMTFSRMLNLNALEINIRIREVYTQRAMDNIRGFNVIQEAQPKLGDDRLRDLARRSMPYQQFHPHYNPVRLTEPANLMFGADDNRNRLKDLNNHVATIYPEGGFTPINLDIENMLLFYREEAAFSVDDLVVWEEMEKIYDEKPGEYGHHTHKDPSVFDRKFQDRVRDLQRWSTAATEIFKGKIFVDMSGGRFGFQYQTATGLPKVLYEEDNDSLKNVARDPQEGGYFAFIEAVKSQFGTLGRDDSVEVVGHFIQQLINSGAHEESTVKGQFYENIIKELFPLE
jgi:hypothetical protein